MPSSASVGWSVALCLVAVLVSRELSRSASSTSRPLACVLSAEQMRSAEAFASREAAVLAQKSASLTAGMNAVLAKVPVELAKVKNLTKELSTRAVDDAAKLKSLEARARRDDDDSRGLLDGKKLAIEAALAEARSAAKEARDAAVEARRRVTAAAAAAAAEATSSSDSSSSSSSLSLSSLSSQIEALEAKSRASAEASARAFDEWKAASERKLNDLAAEAAAEAKKAVASFVGELKSSSSSSSRGRCDAFAELSRLADAAARRYLDGDRVGEFDWALLSAGASVVKALTSSPYTPPKRYIPTSVWHAVGRDAGVGRPEDAISQRVTFGSCFAFAGSRGTLTVRLATPVTPTSFSLEHIHSSLCNPVHNANCSSAPRDFQVFGFRTKDEDQEINDQTSDDDDDPQKKITEEEKSKDDQDDDDDDPVFFGKYQYDAKAIDKPTVQTFPAALQETSTLFDAITLDVLSNHGHPDYTCIYRFRVHGQPPATRSSPDS